MLSYEGFGSFEIIFWHRDRSNPKGIFLCQQKYALDILSKAGLLGAKPAIVPMEQQHRLALADGKLLDDSE